MSNQKRFLRFNTATLVSVYLLILIGAIVRSLGAGMGCPDWPKCFGSYVPPTSAEGLPDDYESIFLEQRLKKNARLANTFELLGWEGLASHVREDKKISVTHKFDVNKAWIEYVNRIVGVLIGLFVFGNMIFSFGLANISRALPALGISIFLLTVFQGWVGSLVVSTNLLPGFITFHMVLALLMVVLLLLMRAIVKNGEAFMVSRRMKWILLSFFVLLIPQIVTGTLTREQVDMLLDNGVLRYSIGETLSGIFFIHRSYSWLLLGIALVTYFQLRKSGLYTWGRILIIIVFIEVVIGILLVYFGMPVFLQPFHLLIGSVLFGAVFYLFLHLKMVKA